jgi:restriction endonuclease Mrr
MLEMEPYDFEKFIAKIWESKGFETNVSQQSRDWGVDIIATKSNTKVAIQAKKYSESNKVGSQDIRNYATVYQQDASINSVVIATSGKFTKPAKKLAKKLDVETINGEDLAHTVKQNKISISEFIGPEVANMSELEQLVFEHFDMDAKAIRDSPKKDLKDLIRIERNRLKFKQTMGEQRKKLRDIERKL